MDEGFILSNKFRRAIFDGFIAGDTNINIIAKKHRIIKKIAIKIAQDFIKAGIIEKKDNKYLLTSKGRKLADTIKG